MSRQNQDSSALKSHLQSNRKRWVVTGAAGFIGSHIVEYLLNHGQQVLGVDDFSSGRRENLRVATEASVHKGRFTFREGNLLLPGTWDGLLQEGDIVLHQAATSSVGLALSQPAETFRNNTESFFRLLTFASKANVSRVVYASSAAIYGNPQSLPLGEAAPLEPISTYGLSKKTNEETARIFSEAVLCVGLRYFNVYGPRQSPNSAYAGVISLFHRAILDGEKISVFGDGNNTRDFIHVSDIVRANLVAALGDVTRNEVFNVCTGQPTSLNELIIALAEVNGKDPAGISRVSLPPKKGDISHSVGDFRKFQNQLAFRALVELKQGLSTLELPG